MEGLRGIFHQGMGGLREIFHQGMGGLREIVGNPGTAGPLTLVVVVVAVVVVVVVRVSGPAAVLGMREIFK